jgi:Zn finger protein HypA/HybF involved in hydrogenase expression
MTVHALTPTPAPFNRTLDQELAALVRGASMECLVCGEFVLKVRGGILACPECGSMLCDFRLGNFHLAEGENVPQIELPSVEQAG